MRNSSRTKNRHYSKHRTLRAEPLERRQLLAVAPIGSDGAIAPDTVEPAYAEVSHEQVGQKAAPVNLDPDAVNRILSEGKEWMPVEAIHVPETLDGPAGRNPDDFERVPGGEFAEKWPLPPEIDPGTFGRPGCPDKEPPGDNGQLWRNPRTEERWQWEWDNETSDSTCRPQELRFIPLDFDSPVNTENLADATKRKMESDWGDDSTSPHPLDRVCEKGSSDKDTEIQDNENPVKDDAGQPSLGKDPDPEGDDPDEGMFPAAREAAMSDPAPTGSSPSGERKPGEDDPWERHRRKIGGSPRDPEDGGPDEFGSPASFGAVNGGGKLGGYNAYPTPDDDGSGPPPGPEFSPDELRSPASSGAVNTSGMLGGYVSYPTPDDDGSGPPPGPEF